MNIFYKTCLVVLVFVSTVGCETTAVKHAAIEVEQAAIVANDLQLEFSEKSLCAAAFSAIGRKYGGHPEALIAMMTLCKWGSGDIRVMVDALK